MNIILYITIFGAIKTSLGDFFSDLEELDIDAQLRELDEMMDNIDTDMGDIKLDDLSSLFSDECVYKCKNGEKPIPRKGHVPSSNGCGSFGLTLNTKALPEMTKCCDQHDFCYDTCNSDREKCDNDFKHCLSTICERLKPGLTEKLYKGCKDTADMIYTGTYALGCSPFLSAQENACDCSINGDKSPKDKFDEQEDKNRKIKRSSVKTKDASYNDENRHKYSGAKFQNTNSGNKMRMINRNEEL